MVNPIKADWEGNLCIIMNNYPVHLGQITKGDEVVIVRKKNLVGEETEG